MKNTVRPATSGHMSHGVSVRMSVKPRSRYACTSLPRIQPQVPKPAVPNWHCCATGSSESHCAHVSGRPPYRYGCAPASISCTARRR